MSNWDGRPKNPEREQVAWLRCGENEPVTALWCCAQRVWLLFDGAGPWPPDIVAATFSYLGPCHTPAEVAALTAEAVTQGREDAARQHVETAQRHKKAGDTFMVSYDEAWARAIRALPPPSGATALAAMLDQARREEREACAAVADKGIRKLSHLVTVSFPGSETHKIVAEVLAMLAETIAAAIRARKETRDAS